MNSSTKRILSLVIVLAMALSMLPMIAFAGAHTTLYVKPNNNWLQGNARFAAYFFGAGETWVSCTGPDQNGVYAVAVPAGAYTHVIFCRMNPGNQTNSWGNKWNQTNDLPMPGEDKNCYFVADNTWDKGNGEWVYYDGAPVTTPATTPSPIKYSVAGVSALCGSDWDPADINNMMTDENEDGIYTITYKNVGIGIYQFKVTDGTWTNSWGGDAADGNYQFEMFKEADVTINFNTKNNSIEVISSGLVIPVTTTNQINPDEEYALVGYIDGADVDVTEAYCFENGTLTTSFSKDSYIFVKTVDGAKSYMPVAYTTEDSAVFVVDGGEKMLVPGGVELTFTLVQNQEDGTLTVRYVKGEEVSTTTNTEPQPEPGAYYVAGSFNEWAAANEDYRMKDMGENIYCLEIPVTAGEVQLKVTGGSWDDGNNWGDNGNNVVVSVPADGILTVTFYADEKRIETAGDWPEQVIEINSVHVVGAPSLTGFEWDPTQNAMTAMEEGIYTITFENVPAGTHEFKFAANGSWDINWTAGSDMENDVVYDTMLNTMANSSVTIPNEMTEGATVILTLDLSAMDPVTCQGVKCSVLIPGKPVLSTDYYVAGDFNDWNEKDPAYLMTDEDADGIYTFTLSVTAGYHSLKVTNGTWDVSWGGTGEGGNYDFYKAEDGTVLVTFDGTTVNVENDDQPVKDYCLVGFINGVDYGCNEDHENVGEYLFVDGTLTATFTAESYVFIKSTDNKDWYLTEAFCEDTTGTFVKSGTEKMKVPADCEITFTLTVNDDGSLTLSYVAAEPAPSTFTVSGAVATGADGDTTIELIVDGAVVATATASGKDSTYAIENVAAGTYTLRVSKKNHVAREYTVTVGEENLVQDVKIHLIGDIDGNGRINVGDAGKVYSHMKKKAFITDEYMLLCADVSGDGRINVGDVGRIYSHIKSASSLWD